MARRTFSEWLIDASGATAIEYALVASLASIVIAVAAKTIGVQLSANYYGKLGAALE